MARRSDSSEKNPTERVTRIEVRERTEADLPPRHFVERPRRTNYRMKIHRSLLHAGLSCVEIVIRALPRYWPVQPFSSVSRAQLISSRSRWRGFHAGQSASRLRGARTSDSCCTPRLSFNPSVKGSLSLSLARSSVLSRSSLSLSFSPSLRALSTGDAYE